MPDQEQADGSPTLAVTDPQKVEIEGEVRIAHVGVEDAAPVINVILREPWGGHTELGDIFEGLDGRYVKVSIEVLPRTQP